MAMKNCSECSLPISKQAKSCPRCGAPNKSSSSFAGTILVLLGIGGVAFCSMQKEDPAEAARREAERMPTTACLMAREFVTKRLRAPSTASFSACYGEEMKVVPVQGHENRFTVVGYVDAENAFSAMIRSPFLVTVEKSPTEKDTWRLVSLTM